MIVGFLATMSNESLADFVRRIRIDKNLSTGDVARRSLGEITDAYVSRIENGYVKNVSLEKLSALAKGLGIAEAAIIRVALGKPQEQPTELIEIMAETFGGESLSDRDWKEIEAVIKTMIDQKKNRTMNDAVDLIGSMLRLLSKLLSGPCRHF